MLGIFVWHLNIIDFFLLQQFFSFFVFYPISNIISKIFNKLQKFVVSFLYIPKEKKRKKFTATIMKKRTPRKKKKKKKSRERRETVLDGWIHSGHRVRK